MKLKLLFLHLQTAPDPCTPHFHTHREVHVPGTTLSSLSCLLRIHLLSLNHTPFT